MLRRSPIRRRRSIGLAARARIREGGPISRARPALSREDYERLRLLLLNRAQGHCEACGSRRITGELEHAVPRSAGGADSWANCWIPCRSCAREKERSYDRGRLLVTPLGDGRFRFAWVVGRKQTHPVQREKVGGRVATTEEAEALATLRLSLLPGSHVAFKVPASG